MTVTTSTPDEQALRVAIVAVAHRLHERGLVAGAEGNVSARLGSDWLLITPAGADKSVVRAQDVVRVPMLRDSTQQRDDSSLLRNGASGDNSLRASSEVEMHRCIYFARPDVGAVVHAHPPVATGFAAAGQNIPANVLPELPAVVGPIALVPYARPGTLALGESLRPWIESHEAFLLSNHGVTTVGTNLQAALHRMESVEQGARSIVVARLLGGAVTLPEGEVQALSAMRLATQVTNTTFTNSVPSANLDQD